MLFCLLQASPFCPPLLVALFQGIQSCIDLSNLQITALQTMQHHCLSQNANKEVHFVG